MNLGVCQTSEGTNLSDVQTNQWSKFHFWESQIYVEFEGNALKSMWCTPPAKNMEYLEGTIGDIRILHFDSLEMACWWPAVANFALYHAVANYSIHIDSQWLWISWKLWEILGQKVLTRQIWGIWKLRQACSPETPNLGQNRWCFVSCDLEILWMTLVNNRAFLLCCFKLCATFHSHWWIQTGVTVRKRPIWVKFDDF